MATHTYSLVITGSCNSQFFQNVMHYSFDDGSFPTSAAAALALCTAWDAANTAAYRSILSSFTRLISLKARALNVSGGFEGIFLYPLGTGGVIGGPAPLSGVGAVVILLPVANAKQRGKFYIPGLPDSEALDGVLTSGYLGTFASADHMFTNQITLVGGGSPIATPVIYSKGPPPVSRQIQYAKLSPLIATMKKRLKPV